MKNKSELLAVLVFLTIILSVSYNYIFAAVSQIQIKSAEHKLIDSGITVLSAAFYHHIESIERIANDWSYWDDLYGFTHNLNDGFFNSNLKSKTLQNTGINMIVFFNAKGNIIYKTTVELEKDQKVNVPAEVFKSNENHSLYDQVLQVISTKKGVSNFVRTNEGPLLFSIFPVLPSNGQGQPAGAFFMGRYFNKNDKEDIYKASGLDFEIVEFVNAPEEIQNKLLSNGEIYESSASRLTGYKLIKDTFGQPTIYIVFHYPHVVSNSYKETLPILAFISGICTVIVTIFLGKKLTISG